MSLQLSTGKVELFLSSYDIMSYRILDRVYDEKIKQRQGLYIMIMEGRGLNLVSLLVEGRLELRVGMSD